MHVVGSNAADEASTTLTMRTHPDAHSHMVRTAPCSMGRTAPDKKTKNKRICILKSILDGEYPTLINALEIEISKAIALSGMQGRSYDTCDALKWALKNNRHFTGLEKFARDADFSKYKNIHSGMITWRDLEELHERNKYPWPPPEGAKCHTPGCNIQQHPDVGAYMFHCCKACAMREYKQMTNWHWGDDALSES